MLLGQVIFQERFVSQDHQEKDRGQFGMRLDGRPGSPGLSSNQRPSRRGFVGRIRDTFRDLLRWGFSSPLMILTIPLIILTALLLSLLLFVLFLVAAPPLLYFLVLRPMRRRENVNEGIIDAEYWVDGERRQ